MIAGGDPERPEEEPADPGDFGFHYPTEYLSHVAWVLEESHFTYWPRAGGLDDQDWFLIVDVRRWFRLVNRLRWEYQQGQWREDARPREGTYDPFNQPH